MARRGASITPRSGRAWRPLPTGSARNWCSSAPGFDAHAEDPVGDLGLEVEDFETLTKAIVAVAETHAAGRIVSVLEGGYNIPILAGCVEIHLHALGAESRTSGRLMESGNDPRGPTTRGLTWRTPRVTPTGFEPVLHA